MMNQRGGYSGHRSSGYNPIRGRQPVRSTSQNLQSTFQPKTEWKEEDADLLLLLHIPGFLKEQVRIVTDESKSYVRVYGERMLINNIRSRFNTGYNIPKNCNLSHMKSELAGGILTIRIPKIIPAVQRTGLRELEALTKPEGPRTQDTTIGQPKPEKKAEEETASGTFVKKETEGEDVETLSSQKDASKTVSQKGQDESPQKANLLANTTKQLDEKTAGLDGEKFDQNVTEKKEKNETYGKLIEEEKPNKVVEKPLVKEEEKDEKSEESKIAESVVLKEKEEEEKNEGAAGGDKEKSKTNISKESKDMEPASTASAKQSDEHVAMVDDANGLIINICIGVSVIMALGAHLYSILSSSSKI